MSFTMYANDFDDYLPTPASQNWAVHHWMRHLVEGEYISDYPGPTFTDQWNRTYNAFGAFMCPARPQAIIQNHATSRWGQGNYAINEEVTGLTTWDSDGNFTGYANATYNGDYPVPLHRITGRAQNRGAGKVALLTDTNANGTDTNAHGRFQRFSVSAALSSGTWHETVYGLAIVAGGAHPGFSANILFADMHAGTLPRDDYMRDRGRVYMWAN